MTAPVDFLEVVRRHCQAELAQDVEAVLATLVEAPRYELHPLGYILSTRDAVREFYHRMLPMFLDIQPAENSATFETGDDSKFVGRQGIVVRDTGTHRDASGRETPVKSLALFIPDAASGLLQGEHIYMNAATARLFLQRLGDDFATIPGVTIE